MRRPPDKDPYTVLGVNRSATQDEIRASYLSRMKVVHPDRFDRFSQAKEWTQAEDMLKELNTAYEILGNPGSKTMYDSYAAQKDLPRTPPPPPPPPRPTPSPRPTPRASSGKHLPFYRSLLFYWFGFMAVGMGQAIGKASFLDDYIVTEALVSASTIVAFVMFGYLGYSISSAIDKRYSNQNIRMVAKIDAIAKSHQRHNLLITL